MLDDMLASIRAAQRLERAAMCPSKPASKRRRAGSSLCEEFVHIFDELDPQQLACDAAQDTSNAKCSSHMNCAPLPHPAHRAVEPCRRPS